MSLFAGLFANSFVDSSGGPGYWYLLVNLSCEFANDFQDFQLKMSSERFLVKKTFTYTHDDYSPKNKEIKK